MCRYAYAWAPYKTSWVCVSCRHVAQYDPYAQPRCPKCRENLVDAGHDFQAPRKRDDSGWAAVAAVLRAGKNYDSCGCRGPGWRPRTKAEVRQFGTS